MIGFIPKSINLSYSSIPLENISQFDKNFSYAQGAMRVYLNNKYIALKDIPQTVHHVWNDTDPLNKYVFDLYAEAKIPNPKIVPVVAGVTLVYVMSNKTYYKSKVTQNLDYTNPTTFNNNLFHDLGANPTPLYRTKLDYPNGKKDTLLWGYEGVLNRYVMIDDVVNKQTQNNRKFITNKQVIFTTNICTLTEPLSQDIYVEDKIKIVGTSLNNDYFKIMSISSDRLSFIVDRNFKNEVVIGNIVFYTQTYIKFETLGIDIVCFFNILCEKIEINIFNGATTTNKIIEMIDSKGINTFELFAFNEPTRLSTVTEHILPTYTQHFEITFLGDFQAIGEVMVGVGSDLGDVEDSVSIDGKIYANIEEATNGDIYVEADLKHNDILDRKQFTMIVDTEKAEYYKNNIKALLGKPVVLSGTEMNNDNYPSLLTYGFIKDYSFRPRFKEEKSTYTFEIREFKEWQ